MAKSRHGGRRRVRRPPPKHKFHYELERHLPSVRLVRFAWLDARVKQREMFEGRPNLERGFLPAMALALVVVIALTAWQLAPEHDNSSGHVGITDGQPSAGGAGGLATQTPPATPTAGIGGGASGVVMPTVARVAPADTDGAFPSGVAAGSMTEARRWAEFRGAPLDVVVTYAARSSWQDITKPWIGIDAEHFKNFAGDWVISQALFPESRARERKPRRLRRGRVRQPLAQLRQVARRPGAAQTRSSGWAGSSTASGSSGGPRTRSCGSSASATSRRPSRRPAPRYVSTGA